MVLGSSKQMPNHGKGTRPDNEVAAWVQGALAQLRKLSLVLASQDAPAKQQCTS